MKIEFTGRHIEVTPALRRHVEEHFDRVSHLFDGKPATAHVIIEVERGRHRSEIVINWRNEVLTATSSIADMYQSLSQTIGKIEKQARRLKDKVIDKSHKAKRTAVVSSAPEVAEKAARGRRIVEMPGLAAKPMSAEEAALHLDGSDAPAVLFRDSSDGRIAVVFRRKDKNFGLIRS
ncbi:MAG: ribosome-associated translation inhibitor RaiA [Chloracidobacterium sp.]|nr:ribosome-associated translation inhibitor RaiA [Chloracidobacterium sp.]